MPLHHICQGDKSGKPSISPWMLDGSLPGLQRCLGITQGFMGVGILCCSVGFRRRQQGVLQQELLAPFGHWFCLTRCTQYKETSDHHSVARVRINSCVWAPFSLPTTFAITSPTSSYLKSFLRQIKVFSDSLSTKTNIDEDGIEMGSNNDTQTIYLRIVLLGMAMAKKSQVEDLILGKTESNMEISSAAKTKKSYSRFAIVEDKWITVVNTPDLDDPNISKVDLCMELKKSISLCFPGPHAFLIVLRENKFEDQDKKAITLIEEIFGNRVFEHSLVLFTKHTLMSKMSQEDLEETTRDIQQLVDRCEKRQHLLNTEDVNNDSRVVELIKKIEEMIGGNWENCYRDDVLSIRAEEIHLDLTQILDKIARRMQTEYNSQLMLKTEEWKRKQELEEEKMEQTLLEEFIGKEEQMKNDYEKKYQEKREKMKDEFQQIETGMIVELEETWGKKLIETDKELTQTYEPIEHSAESRKNRKQFLENEESKTEPLRNRNTKHKQKEKMSISNTEQKTLADKQKNEEWENDLQQLHQSSEETRLAIPKMNTDPRVKFVSSMLPSSPTFFVLVPESATDGSLQREDWGLNMEICDIINETDEGPKDAIRALKKRIVGNKNFREVMLALTVLEACVKNCGHRFHVLVANREFVEGVLVKTILPKNNPPAVVHDKVLSLIQAWADAFRSSPDLTGVVFVYEDLRRKGLEFPMTDLDALSPIHTPQRSIPNFDSVSRQNSVTTPGSPSAAEGGRLFPVVEQTVQPHESSPEGPIVPSTEQMAKLSGELEIVRGNVTVMSEMLTEIVPGQETASDLELLQEQTLEAVSSNVIDIRPAYSATGDTTSNNFHPSHPVSQSTINSLSSQLAALGSNPASVTSTLMTLNAEPKTSKPGEEDEFDMFAQTRTSSLAEQRKNVRYEDPQAVEGLAGALDTRLQNTGAIPTTQACLMDDIEQWLSVDVDDESADTEGVTSEEFDKFLEERAKAAERLPSLPTPPSSAPRTTSTNSSRHTQETAEENLFAL
ncbi:TOM1 protein, partial [Polypterus senegalus]